MNEIYVFLILFVFFLLLFYFRIRGSNALVRQRAKALLFGSSLVIVADIALLVLGFAWIFLLVPAVLFLFFFAYVMLNINLFGADRIIIKTVSSIIIVGLAALAYSFFVYISGPVGLEIYRIPAFSILFILFFLFSYDSIGSAVGKFISQRIFGQKTDFQKLNARISDNIATLLDIKKIVASVKKEIIDALGLSGMEVLITYYKEDGFRNEDGALRLSPQDELFKIIMQKKGAPVSIYDLMENSAYAKVRKECRQKMRELKAELIVPMAAKGRITGILALSEKRGRGLFYNLNEIAFLQNVAFQTAIAVDNTTLYEHLDDSMREIEELHSGLEKKVEERSRQVEEKTEELDKLNAKLKVTTERKTYFLSNMSHELRTPLTAVMGFTELMLSGVYGEASDKVKQAVLEMRKSGIHLTGLINDVLDLSKVEAGQIELKREEVSVREVIKMVEFSTKPLLDEKKLYLKVKMDKNLPVIHADQKRISQVLINLIGNSSKFTKKGGITVRVKQKDDNLLFEVEDTGIGIAKEKLGDVFKEFRQVHTGEYGGTGLGLAICKKLVELHGGKIWVESRAGCGTKFSFTLAKK